MKAEQLEVYTELYLWIFGGVRCRFFCVCMYAPIPLPHHQSLDDGVSVFALIVDHFNVIQVGIGPVNQAVDQVQGDTMRKNNLTVHQLSAVLTIHVTALNPWRRPIVCEEHFTVAGEERKDGKNKMTVASGAIIT